MKSGDFSVPRDRDYYGAALSEIGDRQFVQRTFSSRPALLAKEPVNGRRMWRDYNGGDYDAVKFDLVEDMWDHEHCSVCWFTIKDGFTFWEDEKRIRLLCDACYESLPKT